MCEHYFNVILLSFSVELYGSPEKPAEPKQRRRDRGSRKSENSEKVEKSEQKESSGKKMPSHDDEIKMPSHDDSSEEKKSTAEENDDQASDLVLANLSRRSNPDGRINRKPDSRIFHRAV